MRGGDLGRVEDSRARDVGAADGEGALGFVVVELGAVDLSFAMIGVVSWVGGLRGWVVVCVRDGIRVQVL